MINFACLSPHPPIIIPEIGKENTKKVQSTIDSLKKLSKKLADKDPELLIVITPHGPLHPNKMNIAGRKKLKGDFNQFGAPEVEFEFENDLDLAEKIQKQAEKEAIEATLYKPSSEYARIDHGVLVPLYYLTETIGRVKLLPITYSYQNRNKHFAFGQVIKEVVEKEEKKVGIIASGDLSHRLNQQAPAGYDEVGPEFDEMLTDYLEDDDLSSILKIDPEIIERAGECGYKSLLILLGAISDGWQAEVLSYEGPFGVGYSVVDFKLKTDQKNQSN